MVQEKYAPRINENSKSNSNGNNMKNLKPLHTAKIFVLFFAFHAVQYASAAVLVFASKDAFAYVLTNSTQSKVDFDEYPEGPIAGTEFTNAGFLFTSPLPLPRGQLEVAPADFFWGSKYLNIGRRPYAPGDDGADDSLDVGIIGNWTAAALEFVDTSFPGNAVMTVTFFGNSSNILYTVSAANRNFSFIGIVADEPIRRIYIDEPANDGDDVGYDNFWIGNPSSIVAGALALAISNSSNGICLKWPASNGDYQLEATDLLAPVNWQPLPVTPVFQNGLFEVFVPVDRSTSFFRLRRLD
jgi:hypothetical protein